VTESRQRQIDFGGFLETVPRRTSLWLAFRARQVHNVKFSYFNVRLSVSINLGWLDRDRENWMWAGRVLIHVGCTHVSIRSAFIKHFQHVSRSFDYKRRKILHVNTGVFVFKLKLLLLFGHEVDDFLVVDFEVADTHEVLAVSVRLDLLENVFKSTRHDSFQLWVFRHSRNRESLSCTRLSISKYRPVISLNDILTDGICSLRKDSLLLTIPVVYRIKSEYLRYFLLWLLDDDFTSLRQNLDSTIPSSLHTHGITYHCRLSLISLLDIGRHRILQKNKRKQQKRLCTRLWCIPFLHLKWPFSLFFF
jgi:hypothetical protein